MSKLTLDEAIKHCLEVAEENDLAAGTYEILAENNHNAYERLTAETKSSRCAECAADHRQLAEWLTELKEFRLQVEAPRLGSIEEYHCELARCKAAFWSCNRRCMDAEEQYRRKADELRKAQEQIAEYKRLLKAAVEDFKWLEQHTEDDYGSCMVKTSNISCGNCPFNTNGTDCKWKHEAKALKLIGGGENG